MKNVVWLLLGISLLTGFTCSKNAPRDVDYDKLESSQRDFSRGLSLEEKVVVQGCLTRGHSVDKCLSDAAEKRLEKKNERTDSN